MEGFIVLYMVGMFITFFIALESGKGLGEGFFFVILWPLVLLILGFKYLWRIATF